MKRRRLIIILLAFFIFILIFISPFASKLPDGLEFVSEKLGFIDKRQPMVMNSPVPDYQFGFIRNEYVSKVMAGIIGIIVVFVIGRGIEKILRKRK